MHRRSLSLLLFLALTVVGCDSEGDDGGSDGGGTPGGESTITANVDGEAFAAARFFAARAEGGREEYLIIGRTGGSPVESIELSVPLAEGTYAIGPGQSAGGFYSISEPFSQFSTVLGGSGTITLSEVTEDRFVGTFEFTAPKFTGPDERTEVTITNGVFDVAQSDVPIL